MKDVYTDADKIAVLLHARMHMNVQRKAMRMTLAQVAGAWGLSTMQLTSWKYRHGIDFKQRCKRPWRIIRFLIMATYLPWVCNKKLTKDLGFKNVCSVSSYTKRFGLISFMDPWECPPPIIPYRDIVQVGKMIVEKESLVIVAAFSGYELKEVQDVFGLHRQHNLRSNDRNVKQP